MSVEPLYQLKIPAEILRMPLGIFCFLMICLAGGIAFVVFKMLIPSIVVRPFSFVALIVPVGIIIFCGILGGFFFNQFNSKDPLVIFLHKEGVQFEDSKSLVPYSDIQITRGAMEGLNLSNGIATNIPLGDALVFKINHFDRHFKVNLLKQLSPQYMDKDIYKVPIGDKGMTESQVTEFLEAFKRLSQSE